MIVQSGSWGREYPPALAPACVGGIVAGMKATFIALLAGLLCLGVVRADKDKPLPKDFKALAAMGDAKAQYYLGVQYEFGEGVEKEAVEWFRKAAEQNYAPAQFSLGAKYAAGRGVEKDEKEAVKWYRKAAKQNYALAKYGRKRSTVQALIGLTQTRSKKVLPADSLWPRALL